MTNFEKLCTSTDNMADFLSETMECYGCPVVELCKDSDMKTCHEVMKKWLEMETVEKEDKKCQ